MSSTPLTLYHYWRSSCSWRVRWALALKGVPYQGVAVDILKGEHQQPAYLAKNPSGFLPALDIGGRFFGESLAILDWLEDSYPEPSLYPPSALARLQARQLAMTVASGIQPLANPSLLSYFEPDAAKRPSHMQHFILRGLKVYESLVSEGTLYSIGDHITIADVCLIPQVYNALRFSVDLSQIPRVQAIYQRCLTLPSCRDSAPERFQPQV